MQIPGAIRRIFPSAEGEKLESLWDICVEKALKETGGQQNTESFLIAREKLIKLLPENIRVRLDWKLIREKPKTSL
jgi:hypothetical protein